MNFFHSKWASARGINGDIGLKTKTELDANLMVFLRWGMKQRWRKPSLQSMTELDEISRVQSHFSPHFLLIFLISLARALAILCKLGENYSCRSKLLGFRNGLDRYLNNPPKKHGEQNVKHKPAPLSVKTCSVWKRAPLSLLYNVWFHDNLYFNSVDVDKKGKKPWRSPVFYSSRMKPANDTQHATMGHDETSKTRRGHRHKLREAWKNVPESTMKEVSKAAGLYQSLPQGDSYNSVVGCWFVNDAVRPQEWISLRSSFRCAATFSHLPWFHKPDKAIRKCKSSVGTSSNLNNLDPLLQTSKTSQSKVSDSNSQPSSRADKSGKFTLFSRAIKHSGIHLEVLSLENRNSLNISSVFTELWAFLPKI